MHVDIGGGLPQAVVNAPNPRGGTWNNEGVILFAPLNAGGLFRVPASGGNAVAVTVLMAGQTTLRFPQFLPDGRHFLYFAQGTAETTGVYLASLDAPEGKRLTAADTAAGYLPTGGLLYVRQGTLIFQHFDTARGVLDGDPTTLADPVGFDAGFSIGAFSASATGMVAYRTGAATRRQLTWFDRMGRVAGTIGGADEYNLLYPELSLDGRRLGVSRTVQSNADVWIYDISRGVPTRFTFDAGLDSSPIWSPDGSRIIFRSSRKGAYDLYQKPSSGAGEEVALLVSPVSKFPTDWSPDGRFLLFQNLDPKNGSDLFVLPLEGDRKPSPFVQTPFEESQAQFSPDGRWVAYQSNESGRFEIDVVPFPRPTAKFQISTGGGAQPRWRRDGRELFYVAPDGRLMAVPIRAGASTLEADAPVPLFQTRIPSAAGFVKQQYAVASDGRFLLNNATEESVASPITIVQNWKPPQR